MKDKHSLSFYGRQITVSTLVQYFGKGLQLILSAFTLKLISHYLTEQGYSLYATITEYILFFSILANLGIFGNLVRMMSDHPRDGKIFFNAFLLRVGSALFFLTIACLWAYFNNYSTAFIAGATIFSGVIFFDYLTSVCDAMLQANYQMGRATAALVLGRLISFTGVWALVQSGLGDQNGASFFAASVLGNFVTAGLSIYLVASQLKITFTPDWTMIKRIFLLGLPFGLINVSNNLYFRFLPDYFAHEQLSDQFFSAFSIYFRIAQVLSLISTFMMFSALPALTYCLDHGLKAEAKKIFSKAAQILFALGITMVVLGSLLGPTIITILTHSKYVIPELWFVLPSMLVLAAISFGYDLVLLTLFALKQDFWMLKRELLALFVSAMLFSTSFLVAEPNLKILSIIMASIIAEALIVILGLRRLKKLFT